MGTHNGTLIAGISNSNVGSGSPVFVNENGQLGTILSSGRFKEDVVAVATTAGGSSRCGRCAFTANRRTMTRRGPSRTD